MIYHLKLNHGVKHLRLEFKKKYFTKVKYVVGSCLNCILSSSLDN